MSILNKIMRRTLGSKTTISESDDPEINTETSNGKAVVDEANCTADQSKSLELKSEVNTQAEIETIPLGEDEINTLVRNGYENLKQKFTKTFIIEKLFWAYSRNATSSPPIRVKRVAEIKAASFVHALNLIGWDQRHVSLVEVKDEYDGSIEILVDGKSVGKMTPPDGLRSDCEQFANLSGGHKKHIITQMALLAQNEPSVKDWLQLKSKMVTGWSYEPRHHINLATKKVPTKSAG